MSALFVFLLKVNIALVLFCLGYYLVLRHLTFYTLNRIYLVVAIIFSTLYPQINLSDFAQRHQQLTEPVQNVILNWKAPAENLVKPLSKPDYWLWVEGIFWIGVALLTIRLIMQLFSLYRLYHNSKPGSIQDHPVRLIGDNIGPFSFWRSIYINPANLSPADLKGILEHEQVHVNEWHTVDILLAELSTIFYWFNPGVWLMKKAVRENIEFITDRKILNKGMDSKQYQYSLVSISLATTSNSIVNHFNISTIKKRIIMMNTKRSSGYKLTRYVFLPAVIALLLVFSLSKAAITKTGLRTIKVLDSAISINPIVNRISNTQPFIPAQKANKAAVKHAIKTADTIYAGKSKDGNHSYLVTSDTRPDSVNYVINGVKSTRDAVNALDPGHIGSIEIMSGKDARKFLPELAENKQALFVTTDDSETGKALKAKMDKAMGGGVLATGRKNISVSSMSSSPSDAAPMAMGSGVSVGTGISSDEAPVASDGSNVSTSVTVTSDPKVKVKAMTALKNHVYVTAMPKSTIVLKQEDSGEPYVVFDTIDKKKLLLDKPYNLNTADGKKLVLDKINAYILRDDGKKLLLDKADAAFNLSSADNKKLLLDKVYAYGANTPRNKIFISTNHDANIEHLSDKLIIIDGKEATEKDMKKLKAYDIESLSEKKDLATKKKYGDKAKNGVLFITTKK